MTAWLLYALGISLLAGAGALAGEALLRLYRLPARAVWAVALALSVAGPVVLAGRGDAPARAGGWAGEPLVVAAPPSPAPAPRLAERMAGAIPALWAGASAAVLLALAAGAVALRRRRRGWPAARVAGVPVLVSPTVGPAVVGWLRPAIVVPRRALAWDDAMQRLVVRHESEHIRARDPLLVLCGAVAAALVPWNPGLWWQLRRLRLAVEVDCDTRTLRGGGDVATYGDLLLRVGALGSRSFVPAAAFAEPRSFLERRIRAMTARTPRNRATIAALCGVFTLAAGTAAYALPAPGRPALLEALARAAEPAPRATPAAPAPPRAAAQQATRRADTIPVRDISEVDVKPAMVNVAEIARALEASYPPRLRDASVSGSVLLEMVVQADGSVAGLRVVRSDDAGFNDAALAVAGRIRMRPARMGGRAVPVRLQLPISFTPRAAPTDTAAARVPRRSRG